MPALWAGDRIISVNQIRVKYVDFLRSDILIEIVPADLFDHLQHAHVMRAFPVDLLAARAQVEFIEIPDGEWLKAG
jgi:hypothetical protein